MQGFPLGTLRRSIVSRRHNAKINLRKVLFYEKMKSL